jgi:hypothetical protein
LAPLHDHHCCRNARNGSRVLLVRARLAYQRALPHPDEKVVAIEQLKNHSSGIENKTWKKEQFIEALKDWKPWAFFLYASIAQLPNSLTNQNAHHQ